MRCPKCDNEFEAPLAGGCPRCAALVGGAPEEVRAGFWVRCAARLVDMAVLMTAAAVVIPALGGALGGAAILLGWMLYYVGLTARGGQTVGKMLLKVRVVRTDGSAVDWGRSFVRWLGHGLSAIPMQLGYLWVGLTPRKRGFHDLLADTKVVCLEPCGYRAVLAAVIDGAAVIFILLVFASCLAVFPALR
jgi:uncharacterized RDD family membrane protein YckC